MAAIPFVTEQNFEPEVMQAELPILVEFGATWCGPCKTMAPELEALALELEGKAKILQVDVDKSPRLAQALQIQSVPTFIVFNKGQPVGAEQGAVRKERLRELITPHLPRAAGALSPKEVAQLLQAGRVTMVDTRPKEVFERAHISGAVNYPLDTIEQHLAELMMLPAPAVLYCRGGKEAQEVAGKLAAAGAPVAFVEGGVLGWESEGYSLERP